MAADAVLSRLDARPDHDQADTDAVAELAAAARQLQLATNRVRGRAREPLSVLGQLLPERAVRFGPGWAVAKEDGHG